VASLAQQIAELQARANAEAQALVDAEKARVAKANISGSKLEESELAKKFDDLQDAINASAPHPVTYIFARPHQACSVGRSRGQRKAREF